MVAEHTALVAREKARPSGRRPEDRRPVRVEIDWPFRSGAFLAGLPGYSLPDVTAV